MTAGVDTPDPRGRTGLDRHGRDLTGNPRVRIHDVEVLSCNWYILRNTTFDYQHSDGQWTREQRETYDRGNGATILLYDTTTEPSHPRPATESPRKAKTSAPWKSLSPKPSP
ncbi:hypothetical protein ACWCW7_17885 [Nocardia tengchongensis]